MIIKENEYQGLQDFDVLIEDNNRDSDYFNVTEFPETIPGGKSFFKIAGVPGQEEYFAKIAEAIRKYVKEVMKHDPKDIQARKTI